MREFVLRPVIYDEIENFVIDHDYPFEKRKIQLPYQQTLRQSNRFD